MSSLDSGDITLLGHVMKPSRFSHVSLNVGFMPQNISLHNEFNVGETLNFFGNLYQMNENKLKERIGILTQVLELPPEDRLIRDCSGGQQRRVSLAVAMLHEPSVLICDGK